MPPSLDPVLVLACCTHAAFVSLDRFLLDPSQYRLVWADPGTDADLLAEGTLADVCQAMAAACGLVSEATGRDMATS
jgi:hypothetical protein